MARKLIPLILFFAFLQTNFYAQSLSYSGTNSYNITSPTHISANFTPSLERTPTGMAFGDSGNKLFLIGTGGDMVVQYDLSTAYDPSTRGTIQKYFRVNTEDGTPEDVLFNENDGASSGTKMYILGGAGDDVTQYTLSTAWDVSTATTPVVYDTRTQMEAVVGVTQADRHTGMRFNDDGTKLFIVDRRADRVFEFSLSTAYDISTTGTVDASLQVNSQDGNPRAIEFNNDGSELYMIGNANDQIHTYPLTTNYDISAVGSITSSSATTTQDDTPQALLLDDDGDNFYIAGSANDLIYTYSFTGTAYDFSTYTYDSSATFPSIEIQPRGMVFNPDGTKLFVAGDQLNAVSELALSTPYDISTATFTAGLYVNSEESNINGLAFDDGAAVDPGRKLYIIGTQDDEINVYDLTTEYDLTSTITVAAGSPHSVATFDTGPTDIYFNTDGTKLFVLGNQGNDLNQFSLSPAYDMSDVIGANLDIAFPLNNGSGLVIDGSPTGMAFNTAGTKLYIAGNTGDDINEITLTNSFDLSSGTITNTNTFSVASEEITIHDVIFKPDGSKFYISGLDGDDMNQYQTKGLLPETPNDGTIDVSTPLVITLTGDTFADADADNLLDIDTEFTIANLPEGLTPVFTLSSGDTVATLTFTGKAGSHIDSDEAAANLSFTFTDAAFTSSNAADVSLAVAHTNVMGFDFIQCADDEIVYNGGWTGGSGAGGAPNNTDDANAIRVQGDITITADVDCDCLNVESGQTLTIADGVNLTVTNALELDGDLRLLGSAQLLQTHSGVKNASGSGNLYKSVKGTLENVYQTGYWTSPVTTNGSTYNIAGVLKDGSQALTATTTPLDITFSGAFDGDTGTPGSVAITLSTRFLAKFINSGAWTQQINESTELLNPGEGFSKKSTGQSGGQNYIFVGRPNDGDYSHTISAFGSGTWSLLGNPYSSPLDIDQFTTDNATAIEGTIYFYEAGNDTSHSNSSYLGGYATRFMGSGNSASDLGDGTGIKDPGQYIGVGQGFFVEASASGGTITFSNDQRSFNTVDEFFSRNESKKKSSSFPILKIGFEFVYDGKTYHRPVTVGFRDFINTVNEYKGAEMWDYNPTDMALKLEGDNLPYVITMLENYNSSLVIPLKVRADVNRDVTFKINEMLSLDTNVYLYDAVTNVYHNITSEDAIVNIDAGAYDDRFFITFNETVLSVEDAKLNSISIVNKKNELVISSLDVVQEVFVFNLLGQEISNFKNIEKQTQININTKNYKRGVYLVKIKNTKGIFSTKIIIN